MLRPILAVASKDLVTLVRDRRALVTLFLMPAMFVFVMTMALSSSFRGGGSGPTAVQHNVPAWTLFGVFFIAQNLATSVLEERRLGTVTRLLVSPAPRSALLLGKLLPCLVVNLAQVAVLFGVGVFLMPVLGAPGLALGAHPFALIPISVAASLSATGLGLLLATLARTLEQLGGIGTMVTLTMAALGGVMVPRSIMPATMRSLGLATPHAWALGAYQDVLIRSQGLAHVLPAIGMLVGFAALFFTFALVRFRWE